MSLICWYPLNGDTLDYSGNNNHATNNGATIDANGKIGSCYSFDGINNSISIPWQPTPDFSVCMWFYKSEWGPDGHETLIGGPSGFELESKVGTTNSPVLRLYNWGWGTTPYELSKWNHIVLRRTSTNIVLYLNGELVLTSTAIGTNPTGQYFIGAWLNTNAQNFKGKINDVRIYDHALSEKEIREIAKAKILHYTFDQPTGESEGLVVRDISGYRNDAVLDLATSPQWIEDSKIGSGAYKFKADNIMQTNILLEPKVEEEFSYDQALGLDLLGL